MRHPNALPTAPTSATSPDSTARRRFLQTGAALFGGMLLEIHANGIGIVRADAAPAARDFAPNAWVRIAPDGEIWLVSHKFDSGTGVKNALGLILAEELDADWSQVKVIAPDDPLAKAYIHPLWGMHATGGSTSVSLASCAIDGCTYSAVGGSLIARMLSWTAAGCEPRCRSPPSRPSGCGSCRRGGSS